MDLPLEGRISGPSTGFEVTVPGRQGIRAMRNSIPLAGAPTSIETSLRGLLFFCSARFLLVVSRKAACPAHQRVENTISEPATATRDPDRIEWICRWREGSRAQVPALR